MIVLLYIIRHGETYGNINGDGFTETDLTPNGMRQIAFLGKRFKDTEIGKIYTSPLKRAIKTSNAIKSFHEATPLVVDFSLLEKGTDPDYSGLSDDEILKLSPYAKIGERKALGEENDEKAYARAKEFIKKIKAENDFNSTVVVVAHGTFNSFLVLAALDFPLKENFNFSHLNTGVTLVNYLEENGVLKTKLKYLNDTKHLD